MVLTDGAGAKIVTSFRLPMFAMIFISIWLSAAFLIGWIGGIAGCIHVFKKPPSPDPRDLMVILPILAFPFLGVAFIHFCRIPSISNEQAVLQLLTKEFGPPLNHKMSSKKIKRRPKMAKIF